MKKIILLPALLTGLFATLHAQDSLPAKHPYYKASVFTDSKHAPNGYLSSISDSSLNISLTPTRLKSIESSENNNVKFYFNNISKVKLKRKGAVGRGMLIGALIGLSAGAISGFAAGDDPPCTRPVQDPNDVFGLGLVFSELGYGLCETFRTTAAAKATSAGFAGAIGGALVGALVGSLVHKTFIIGRDKKKLQEMKAKLIP